MLFRSGKIYFAAQEGVDKNVAVITSFLDSMLQVIGSLLVAAVFFLIVQRAPGVDDSLIYLTYALTAALLLCLVPRVFNFLVNLVHKVLKRTAIGEKYRMTGGAIWGSTAVVVGAKILSGMAVAIIALSAFGKVSLADFFYVVAANCAATAIGMAALFAPAGLGVKESLQVVLLGAVFPREVQLSHRDILGGLMGLGLDREKLGDILILPGKCQVLALTECVPILLSQWDSAGRARLKVRQIPLCELEIQPPQVKEIRDTVAALRLDAVLAAGFSLSRGKAAELIAAGRAAVNHRECTKVDKTVEKGDVITCRGLGKCVVKDVPGQSRKGRTMVVMERYI